MKLRKGFNLNLCGIWSVKRPTIIFALLIRLFVGGEETCTIFLPLPFLVTWLIYFRECFGWELSATSPTIMLVKIFLQYLIYFLIESSPLRVLSKCCIVLANDSICTLLQSPRDWTGKSICQFYICSQYWFISSINDLHGSNKKPLRKTIPGSQVCLMCLWTLNISDLCDLVGVSLPAIR